MLYIKSIRLRKIQSHIDLFIELPATGIVGFVGNNSNGKSVIGKTLDDIIRGNINKPKTRRSLVNDDVGNMWGEIELLRSDGLVLLVHIHLEASQTYFELGYEGQEKNRAYLASKSLPSYIREFGFHYEANHKMSLNLCDSDDAVFLFKTPHKLNYDVWDPAATDDSAVSDLEKLENIISEARKTKAMAKDQVTLATATLNNLTLYDIEEEANKKQLLEEYVYNLEKMILPEIPKLEPVPTVETIDFTMPYIPKLVYPFILDINTDIPDIVPQGLDINKILLGKCPTCNRNLYDCEDFEDVRLNDEVNII